MLALVGFTAALPGCGSDQVAPGTPSRPTLGSSEDATAEVAMTPATAPVDETIGPPLSARAPASEILAAVQDVHRLTGDASGQMNRFAPFPDLDTPAGAEITELRADARTTLDGTSLTVVAELALNVPGAADDAVAFYRRELQDRQWTLTGDTAAASRPRRLTFEQPDSAYPLDDLVLTVDPDPAGGDGSVVRLHYVETVPGADPTVRERFAGWAADLPLPPGGEITGAGIQTSNEGRSSLHLSLTVDYGDADPAELADELRLGLPTDTFGIDAKPPTGDALDNWVYLSSPVFAEARVSPHVVAAGTTLVNVTARIPFTPA